MPYRKKYKGRKKRYAPRRKKKAYPGRGMPGFPATRVVKMRYVDSIVLDAPVNARNAYIFRANSIFDPDISGIGHQPLGHDQWAQFYNHYVVIGAKINVTFNASAANQDAQIVGIYSSDDITIPTTALEIIEQGLCRWKSAPIGFGDNSAITLVNTYSAKKTFNVTNVKDNFDRLGAGFDANPPEISFFHLFTQSLDPQANPAALNCLVTISYIVLMSEPKSLPQS